MRRSEWLVWAVAWGVCWVSAASPALGQTASADHPELSGMRLNQIQVIGTHNSYKLAIQPELFELMVAQDRGAESLDYRHMPLSAQLDLGVRNLELDLYHDPEGGHYAQPLGLRLLRASGVEPWAFNPDGELDRPGFKVLHDCNFDYRSHTPRLDDTLAGLRHWSAANPGHLPVFVTLNLKGGDAPAPGAIDPVEWDADALDALDRALVRWLGRENLLVPDDVRGEHSTLVEAIEAEGGAGWPTVRASRGRFIFVMDQLGRFRTEYLRGHEELQGRVMFTSGPVEASDAAILIINDPDRSGDRIRALVERGRIVRTRADAGTWEMRAGDRSRMLAAMASGAQIITTDYPVPDERHNPEYRVVFGDARYARINVVTGPDRQDAAPSGSAAVPGGD